MKYLFAQLLLPAIALVSTNLVITTNTASAQEGLGSLQELMPPSQGKPGRRTIPGHVQVFDNRLTYPLPVWSSVANGAAPAERSRIRSGTKNGRYSMRMIPNDETFEDWTSIFTISSAQKPTGGNRQRMREISGRFRTVCSPSNLQIFPLGASPKHLVQVVACGNYSRDREIGLMAAIVTLRNSLGEITMTRQWRTKAFQASIRSNWPIPQSELDGVLKELVRSKLTPNKKK